MSAKVTITFTSDHPAAMMLDWIRELGLLHADPSLVGRGEPKLRKLGVTELQVEVENVHGGVRGVSPTEVIVDDPVEPATADGGSA